MKFPIFACVLVALFFGFIFVNSELPFLETAMMVGQVLFYIVQSIWLFGMF